MKDIHESIWNDDLNFNDIRETFQISGSKYHDKVRIRIFQGFQFNRKGKKEIKKSK